MLRSRSVTQQPLSRSEYASALNGAVVTIVETSWVDPGSAGGSSALDNAASSGLALALPDPPTT